MGSDWNDAQRAGTSARVEADRAWSARQPRPNGLDIISPAAWHGVAVPERRWLVDGMIPIGGVTLLTGDGGVGKSLVAMQLLIAATIGRPWLGVATTACPGVGVFCEDDADELHRRSAAILDHYEASFADLTDLRYLSRVGLDNLLVEFNYRGGDAGKVTALYQQLVDELKALRARLLVLDTAADLFGGNENFRGQVRFFINLLRRIAIEIDGAVLLTSHPSVQGIATGTGISGSTAWSNSVRSRLYLQKPKVDGDEEPDPDARVLRGMKANYGPTGGALKLRYDRGVFVPVGEPSGIERAALAAKAERVFVSLLDRLYREARWVSPNPAARNFAPRVFALHPNHEGLTERQLNAAMEALFARRAIRVEAYGPPSKNNTRLCLT